MKPPKPLRMALRPLPPVLFVTSVGMTVCMIVSMTVGVADVSAQTAGLSYLPEWSFTGEVGALVGGTWLSGTGVPEVKTSTGAQLAIGAQRRTGASLRAGAAARLSAQPLTLKEVGVSWSGGTVAELQIVGTAAVDLPQRGAYASQLDLAGGLSFLSGASAIFPFSRTARAIPAADVGFSVRRVRARSANEPPRARRQPIAVFVRYGIVRVDPASVAGESADVAQTTAGFVGRATVGLRIAR